MLRLAILAAKSSHFGFF